MAISFEKIIAKSDVDGFYQPLSFSVTGVGGGQYDPLEGTLIFISNALEPLVYEAYTANITYLGGAPFRELWPTAVFYTASNGNYTQIINGFSSSFVGDQPNEPADYIEVPTTVSTEGVDQITITGSDGETATANPFTYGREIIIREYELTTETKLGKTTTSSTSTFAIPTTTNTGTSTNTIPSSSTNSYFTVKNGTFNNPTWRPKETTALFREVDQVISTVFLNFRNDIIVQPIESATDWTFSEFADGVSGNNLNWYNFIPLKEIKTTSSIITFQIFSSLNAVNSTAFSVGNFIGNENGVPKIVTGKNKIVLQKSNIPENSFTQLTYDGLFDVVDNVKFRYTRSISRPFANAAIAQSYTSTTQVEIPADPNKYVVTTFLIADWGYNDLGAPTTAEIQHESSLVTENKILQISPFFGQPVTAASAIDIALKINSNQGGGGGYESVARGQIFGSYTYNQMIACSNIAEISGSGFTFSKDSYTVAFGGETSSNIFNTTGVSTSQWEANGQIFLGKATAIGGKLSGNAVIAQGIYETHHNNESGKIKLNLPSARNWNGEAEISGYISLANYSTTAGLGVNTFLKNPINEEVIDD